MLAKRKPVAVSFLADCLDIVIWSEDDSRCHGYQTFQPAGNQTAGYGATGDTLNQPLKRNFSQRYMPADNQSSLGGGLEDQLDSR